MKNTNKSLYNDDHPKTSIKGTGFKDKQKALDTLKIIKNRDIVYQKLVVTNITFLTNFTHFFQGLLNLS